jgi:hypothetical protein
VFLCHGECAQLHKNAKNLSVFKFEKRIESVSAAAQMRAGLPPNEFIPINA